MSKDCFVIPTYWSVQGVDSWKVFDHPTPIEVRTHTGEPIPYLLYDSTGSQAGLPTYNEKTAASTGRNWADGYRLIGHLLQEELC